jgi:hypothetical protein
VIQMGGRYCSGHIPAAVAMQVAGVPRILTTVYVALAFMLQAAQEAA